MTALKERETERDMMMMQSEEKEYAEPENSMENSN